MLYLADKEHEFIVQRTKAGLAARRAKGQRLGRESIDIEKIRVAKSLVDTGMTIVDACHKCDISRSSYYKHITSQYPEFFMGIPVFLCI